MNVIEKLQALGALKGGPADKDALAKLDAALEEEFGVGLPADVEQFLGLMDGAEWNGLVVYATSAATDPIPAFLDRNLHFDATAGEAMDSLLIVGQVDDELLAFDVDTLEYLQLDRSSMEAIARFPSLETLIARVLEELGADEDLGAPA